MQKKCLLTALSKNRPSANSCQTAAANCALFFTHLANCFRRVRFTPMASHTVSVVNRLFKTHWLTGQVPPNHKKACALEGRRISKSFSSPPNIQDFMRPPLQSHLSVDGFWSKFRPKVKLWRAAGYVSPELPKLLQLDLQILNFCFLRTVKSWTLMLIEKMVNIKRGRNEGWHACKERNF